MTFFQLMLFALFYYFIIVSLCFVAADANINPVTRTLLFVAVGVIVIVPALL